MFIVLVVHLVLFRGSKRSGRARSLGDAQRTPTFAALAFAVWALSAAAVQLRTLTGENL